MTVFPNVHKGASEAEVPATRGIVSAGRRSELVGSGLLKCVCLEITMDRVSHKHPKSRGSLNNEYGQRVRR